ncbi:MAG: fibrobacter succinogenes major paralogous domain-containing protein [Paludibacter sp.]|nr:fibrobacter succinogenes major paralogous domain-containing protein [Paludibacter sp.]
MTLDGVAYGSQETFTTLAETPETGTVSDVDGNTYHYITIGTQRWMVENLRTTKYRNGDIVGTTPTPDSNISSDQSPKYQWPSNGDESIVATYGRLYTWYAVKDSRGLAPNGWHVATDAEWETLQNYLIANGNNYDKTTTDNKIAQSLASNSGWMTSSIIGSPGYDISMNNSSGLSMYPTAGRFNNGFYTNGLSFGAWTQSESDSTYALRIQINNNGVSLLLHLAANKNYGWAVRCVMD